MRSFRHIECSTGRIAEVRKLNKVAQNKPGKPKKALDEMFLNDRLKLGMDSSDPHNHSEWRGHLRGRLVKQVPLSR